MIKLIILMSLGTLISTNVYAGICDEYLADANAISGVVPRMQNGKLKSISMYGVQSFIAPKSSLINKARRQAELKAKRNFSEWTKEKIAANTLNEELLESAEITATDGSTKGYAEEISKYADYISSSTSSVLSGIVKLDECVDKADKTIYVRMGWKPSLSMMASSAVQTINKQKPTVSQTSGSSSSAASATASKAHSIPKTSTTNVTVTPTTNGAGVKIIAVTVEGTGNTSAQALNAALKQAVSQVFGQQFSSSTTNLDTLVTESVTDSQGNTSGSALEASAMTEAIRSKTKGVIHSYNIVSTQPVDTGVSITVNVHLAKYDKGIDARKKSIVILPPAYKARNKGIDTQTFTASLQDSIESRLSSSGYFNILDRESLSEMKGEMNFIAENGDISEIARIGNMAGTDRIVITTVMHYSPQSTQRIVGERTITSNELNATVSIKVIDPATSQVVLSRNVAFNHHKLSGATNMQTHINLIASKAASMINRFSGNKMKSNRSNARPSSVLTVKQTKKEIDQNVEKLRSKSNDDW
jgi:hypothetical protein